MKDEIIINETATPTEAEANSASATSANGANASADAKAAATVTINVVNGNNGEKATPVVIPMSAKTASGEASYDRTGYADANPAEAGERKDKMNSSDKTPWWGWLLWAILGIAVLAIVIFAFRGCDGDGEFRLLGTVPAETTDPEPAATTATASSDDEKDAIIARQDAEINRLTAIISAVTAQGIVVNVDNHNNVEIDLNAWVTMEQYQLALEDVENVKIELSNVRSENEALHKIWDGHTCECNHSDNHVCDHTDCEKALKKAEEERDYWRSVWMNHTCPQPTSTDHSACNSRIKELENDVRWLTEQLAAEQEKEPKVVTKTETKTVTVKDTEEVNRLNKEITSLKERISELEDEISNHVCPEADHSYCNLIIIQLQQQISDLEQQINDGSHNPSMQLQQQNEELQKQIEELQKQIENLQSQLQGSSGAILAEGPDQYGQTGQPDGDGAHNDSPRGRGNN